MISRETILIIEDNLNMARRIVTLCFQMGHEPLLARDGYTGMLLAHRVKPRLIISDIAIPGMDGFEVVRRVRKHHELDGTAVVALTETAPRKPAANQAGFDDFVLKSCSAEQLEHVISKFCVEMLSGSGLMGAV